MEIRQDLPGADLVESGLSDLQAGRETAASLLVASFSSRLRRLGFAVPDTDIPDPELRLYRLLERTRPNPHHFYNALRRRLVSFAEARECVR